MTWRSDERSTETVRRASTSKRVVPSYSPRTERSIGPTSRTRRSSTAAARVERQEVCAESRVAGTCRVGGASGGVFPAPGLSVFLTLTGFCRRGVAMAPVFDAAVSFALGESADRSL